MSQQDRTIAVGILTQYAKQQAPKHIGKVAGRRMAECLRIMAKMAFEDYARSAAATSDILSELGVIYLNHRRFCR
ncbi:antitermination protein [Rahnella sp. 2050]|uniref:antitermination protein Q n=1 Tax=Rahnella sp. 2050 TaxID=3156425 RepID=UPI0033970BED